jgi:hypothetical protein
MDDTNASGGVVMNGAPQTPEPTVPEAPVSDQPFVVPAAAAVPSAGNPLPKRLLMVAVFLVLLVVLFAGGKFVFGLVAGTKTVTITYWGLWENDSTLRSVLTEFEATHPK